MNHCQSNGNNFFNKYIYKKLIIYKKNLYRSEYDNDTFCQ